LIYCVSDIHGEADRFHTMLETINFTADDTLYVIGDVIDRHPGGVDILKEVMAAPNMVMLLGNHEQMCLDTLGPHSVYGSRALWKQNGGSRTYRELLYICEPAERRKIINFLLKLPDHLDIEVQGRKFHLVHGYPSDDPYTRIWERPVVGASAPMAGCTVIVGHTPTSYLTGHQEEDFRIWHGKGIIDIDCGCGGKNEFRHLACLRLDDMREFYV
jgi:serine/threonine protein phosphatase 1